MKARVITFLNIRTGTPEILPGNNPGGLFFKSGDVIEIAEAVTGEKYKDNDVWYKLEDGTFVWSGGVHVNTEAGSSVPTNITRSVPDFTVIAPGKISWAHSSLRITDIWKESGVTGSQTRVLVVDEGFDRQHEDLQSVTIKEFSALPEQVEHGTEMLGIIGAKGIKVYGVAPGCELFFAKADLETASSIAGALQWALDIGADVISLSFKCVFDETIEAALGACFTQNIAIVAAAGDSGQLNKPRDIYPASSPSCFAIGCFGKDFTRMAVSNLTENLKLMAPAEAILTAEAGDTAGEDDGETSLATAFTAGTVALLLSAARAIKKETTGKEIIDMLCRDADKRNNGNEAHTAAYGFGLLAPYQTYRFIKQQP